MAQELSQLPAELRQFAIAGKTNPASAARTAANAIRTPITSLLTGSSLLLLHEAL